MGTSKGVLLGGVALIIGFYTVGIKKADRSNSEIAEMRANDLQSENIAQSGIRFAANELVTGGFDNNSSHSCELFGGTLTYNILSINLERARVTSTGQVGGRTITVVAEVQKIPSSSAGQSKSRGNMWQIEKVYAQPL